MLYIAYGSNLHLGQMAHRCPTAKVVGASEMKGYDLLFRGSRHSAVATIEPLKGPSRSGSGSVPILLWDIKKQDERSLDRYEGWPSFYRKELHKVEFEGKRLPAMVYIMNEGHEFGAPSDSYYNTIREGYKSATRAGLAGFNLDYLDRAVEQSSELAFGQDELRYEQDLEPGLDQSNLFDMKWW